MTTAEYLFTRLHQLGLRSIFGVPGDYNLRLLDYVSPSGLEWIGTCNELNAAYAADGYSRIHGLSALVTTYGVGELSAVNGIAGAYAERVPLIHIVGSPARVSQEKRELVHHTLGDGDYRRFAAMAKHITVAQVNLGDFDPRLVPGQIDYLLQQALVHRRPVYLEIPDDMVDVSVSGVNLQSTICIAPAPQSEMDGVVLERILQRIYTAKQPLILVDGESRVLDLLEDIHTLVKTTKWPTWTTIFGKGLVHETLSNVYGIYFGAIGDEQYKKYFDSADLIINLGPHPTDTNSYNFSTLPDPNVTITFSWNRIQIGNDLYRDISPQALLSAVVQELDTSRILHPSGPPKQIIDKADLSPNDPITQKHFYQTVNRLFRPGDVILTETGTAAHGGRNFTLPPGCRLFGAVTWLSIGYMLPATLGAALAQQEHHDGMHRAILFIGDGSLQMTVQEISTMIKQKLNIIIFVINNEGYTIERAIHGRKQEYNDIAAWKHSHLLRFLGADEEHAAKNNFVARTWAELDSVLEEKSIQEGSGVRIVEVFMGREDVEGALLRLLQKQIEHEA